jgi:hypothetical protein
MQKAEAKRLSLEVWRYLRDHPDIGYKGDLPNVLWDQIRDFRACCPLCQYDEVEGDSDCMLCPLYFYDNKCAGGEYSTWSSCLSDRGRRESAAKIVELIEDWDIGER